MKRTAMTAALALAGPALGGVPNTFFFTGPSGGDFFDEANWTTAADGSGFNIAGDPLQDSASNAIALNLIIDGDAVTANGQVDFGPGSLTLGTGALLNITGGGNDLDINDDSTFSLTAATLIVDDIINFEGTSAFVGGTVVSSNNDIAFQDNFTNLAIEGTTFTAFDNIYFDGQPTSIANATFITGDRLGVRNGVDIFVTDTSININTGTGDVDDVFAAAAAGSSLTLQGNSNLVADSIEEGAELFIEDNSIAVLGGLGIRVVTIDSAITLSSEEALLTVRTLDPNNIDFIDARPFLINGLTGQSYADDSSTWNITDWNGSDAVTLQLIPEPGTAALLGLALALVQRRRRA